MEVIHLCINGKVRIFKLLNNETEDGCIGLVMALPLHELMGDSMFCNLYSFHGRADVPLIGDVPLFLDSLASDSAKEIVLFNVFPSCPGPDPFQSLM